MGPASVSFFRINGNKEQTASIGIRSSWGRVEKEGVVSMRISPVPGDGGCGIVY